MFSVVLPIISAAMLCPVLLCATLLLLSPQEIAEARALHPSPDAVQVQVEGGREERKIEWIAKDSVHKGHKLVQRDVRSLTTELSFLSLF